MGEKGKFPRLEICIKYFFVLYKFFYYIFSFAKDVIF